ncbi:MAG: VIT domain-containing protein, partial [bacterium]
ADGQFGGKLEIRRHDVDVTINNGVAVTKVKQVFKNTEDRQVEALYTFPVPKQASVSNFSMMIDGKEMVGEVIEKERAREIYNSYKSNNEDPGLLEQKNYKRFEMRIFPIGAQDTQVINLTYYQELNVDHNWASYTYPLATVTEDGLTSKTTGRFSFDLKTKSAIPIFTVNSPTHSDRLSMVKHTDHFYEASFESDGGDLNKDIVVEYKLSRPVSGVDMVTSAPGPGDGYFLMTMTVGQDLKALKQGMDYVFVLDRSGSMEDDSKYILSRRAVNKFLGALIPKDRFEVITFNNRPYTLFDRLRKAGATSTDTATGYLNDQQAQGGTRLMPALKTAYKYKRKNRQLNVVILSDGMTDQAGRAEL